MTNKNDFEIKKKVSPKIIIALVAVVFVIVLFAYIFQPMFLQKKYDNAIQLIRNEEYAKAYEEFTELGNYKDSKDYLSDFFVVYDKKEIVNDGINRITEYTFNDKGQVLSRIEKDVDGGYICDSFKYTYDKDGNMLSEEWTPRFDKSNRRYEYQYDENGNRVSEKYIRDGKTEWEWFNEYDERGNCIKRNLSRVIEYQYDKKDRRIKEIYYSENGELNGTVSKVYDRKGNVILSETVDADGNLMERTEIKYNRMRQIVCSIRKNGVGDIIDSVENIYDKNGNLVESIKEMGVWIFWEKCIYDNDGNMLSSRTWSKRTYEDGNFVLSNESVYTYDKKGNCLTNYYMSYDERYGKSDNSSRNTYDERGNLIRSEYEIGSTEYKYYGERHIIYRESFSNTKGYWTS